MQSSYRKFHSTETALLRVQNDLLKAIDSDGAAILVLLDLSAAFDTIDHEILLSTLENEFGVTDKALSWFRSYLSDRYQSVIIDGVSSKKHKLHYGVPQGSVLGPLLFISYTKPLGKIIRKMGLQMHFYADDTQLYIGFKPNKAGSVNIAMSKIYKCVSAIKKWMATNFLKLNDDKTEIMVLARNKKQCDENREAIVPVKIGDCVVEPKEYVRNLGVIFDSTLSLERHVNNVCKNAYYQIKCIGRIRKYLDLDSTKTLIHAYVTSRLDYCNSLLFGLPKYQIQKLQRVQNAAARLVTGSQKFDKMKPVLKDLHRLKIQNFTFGLQSTPWASSKIH